MPADHRLPFRLRVALQRHGVDLDREARLLRGVDALHDAGEIAPAGQGLETVRLQRIQRNVHALHAAIRQLSRVFRELRAVGGDGQLVQRAGDEMAGEGAEQSHDLAAHQRLAAGDPELARALGDEGGAEPVQLLKGQQVLFGQEAHVLGHAIDAAEIAAVGDRNAQIADGAAEGVDHRLGFGGAGLVEGCW
jgi:hypothetical protein